MSVAGGVQGDGAAARAARGARDADAATPARGRSPPMAWLLQLMGVLVLRAFVRFAYRARVRIATPLPEGPCVYASNHRSFLDPAMVGMWSRVPVSYFARANLWRVPIVAFMLRAMRGIPVERENPGLSSFRGAVGRLREGIPVLVFPEGTRTRTGRLGRLREGPALFARRAGVPIVPVYLHRTEAAWPRDAMLPRMGGARIEVRFGRPLRPPEHLPEAQRDAWIMTALERWMRRQELALLGPERRRAE